MLENSGIDSVFSCLLGTATFFRAIATNSSFDTALVNKEHVAEVSFCYKSHGENVAIPSYRLDLLHIFHRLLQILPLMEQ